ncbi:MAG: hypothetical protein OEY43_10650, partial [Gammaproteobacteria bacterium]|nr:hypothetical protein [Gammaproteobacteria bacterium]
MQAPVSIPSNQPFLQHVARQILQAFSSQLPDLSDCHIFLPNAQAAFQLRQALGREAGMTLVGPYIGSMRQWVNENTPLVNNDRQQINQPTRQLLLLEALKKHSHLFNQLNIWLLCDSLLVLFDELTSHKLAIDKPDLDDWTRLLQQAYGNEDISLTQLSEEACLVHTLWHAWQKQMLEMNICDSNTAYHQRLQQLQTYIPVNTCFYIICAEQLNSAETEW